MRRNRKFSTSPWVILQKMETGSDQTFNSMYYFTGNAEDRVNVEDTVNVGRNHNKKEAGVVPSDAKLRRTVCWSRWGPAREPPSALQNKGKTFEHPAGSKKLSFKLLPGPEGTNTRLHGCQTHLSCPWCSLLLHFNPGGPRATWWAGGGGGGWSIGRGISSSTPVGVGGWELPLQRK